MHVKTPMHVKKVYFSATSSKCKALCNHSHCCHTACQFLCTQLHGVF